VGDDLFSRLFELFNQPGPVNWKLAAEVAHHLAGERAAIDPWAAEQLVELSHFSQARLEPEAPFPLPPPAETTVVDARQWVDQTLEGFGYLGETIADATAGPIPGMGAALAGMQVGSTVGTIASAYAGAFEAGLAYERPTSLLLIGPGIERVHQVTGADPREARLWAVASEIVHRGLFAVPWLLEHVSRLLSAYAVHLVPDPDKIMEIINTDPNAITQADPDLLQKLMGGSEGLPHRRALQGLLSITTGYCQFLVERAFQKELPSVDRLGSPQAGEVPMLGIPLADSDLTRRGARFCAEVEKRYGRDAVDGIWIGPERLPVAAELDDPVGWAARVLLEDMSSEM
jgi:putative hydrolase